jgi:hypothetical protein
MRPKFWPPGSTDGGGGEKNSIQNFVTKNFFYQKEIVFRAK